jgi:S-DNA-T family DNA segregation ATPase FtsK/SpoIIIE
MSGTSKPKKSKATSKKEIPSEPIKQSFSLDRFLDQLKLRFNRFGRDLAGVSFIAVAVLTLLGLTGLTSGAAISPWSRFLKLWFGYGSYLIALGSMVLGFFLLKVRLQGEDRFRLGKIIAWEFAFFDVIGLLAIFGGQNLENAEAGLDGGIIGWGIANLFTESIPMQWGTIFLVLILMIAVFYGLGLKNLVIKILDQMIDRTTPPLSDPNIDSTIIDSRPKKADQFENSQKLAAARKRKGVEDIEDENPLPAFFNRSEEMPPLDLLAKEMVQVMDEERIKHIAHQIELTLDEFGIPAHVKGFKVGPTVTQFAVEPGFVEKMGPDGQVIRQKVRVSQISSLARDLALALSAERLRIEAPVPGRSYVGIEVPNPEGKIVRLRPILESESFLRLGSSLGIALGQDVSGNSVIADLARMPHMLIAGTTGSGKSVCVAAITTCLVMNNSPKDLKLAMLDPKMVELVRFNGLPHLLGKVETSIERMLGVLHWAIAEMDTRYRLLEEAHARDLDSYNKKMERKKLPTLPKIVILIDELADLMMSAPDQTESSLVRLAQMARATGIHLVVATQRPSTDVVTGLIKANFPARIAFTVASSIDSRVILDSNGAETLLGKGDMLFLNPEIGTPQRAQGVMITDREVESVITYWQDKQEKEKEDAPWEELLSVSAEDSDDMLNQAIELVRKSQRASASLLQRRLRIGYPRAARLLDQLEDMGIVGPSQGGGRDREVMIDIEDEEDHETDSTSYHNDDIA